MRAQVVGAGSWGLALARLLDRNGHSVSVWCHERDDPDTLRRTRERPKFLPGIKLAESIEIVEAPDASAELVVYAVPSHVMRTAAEGLVYPQDPLRVSVAKGIENETLLRMSEVLREVTGSERVLALSGPSHAEEVARDKPCSVCVAGSDFTACTTVQDMFHNDAFRVYSTQDLVGVELGGSLKNVIAIAAGVCDGLGLGDNARAALITRGLAEIARLGVKLGAEPQTFAGLSGMGDLIVTCTSAHSRNHAVGERLAQGMTLDEAVGASPMVAEGVRTAQSVHALSRREGVEMPIAEQVYRTLFEGVDPRQALTELMTRESKAETG